MVLVFKVVILEICRGKISKVFILNFKVCCDLEGNLVEESGT